MTDIKKITQNMHNLNYQQKQLLLNQPTCQQAINTYQKYQHERCNVIQSLRILKNNLCVMFLLVVILSLLPIMVTAQEQLKIIPQNNIKIVQPKQQEPLNYIPAEIVTDPINPINNPNLNNPVSPEQIIEIQKDSQLTQAKKDQLQPWIREQMDQLNIDYDLPISQTFQFVINEGEQLIYKWDPSKNKELKMVINVFSIGRIGDLEVMRSSEENQYVEILTKNPNKAIFIHLGKVYSGKIFTVDFDTDYKYLKFINKNDQRALVQIDIEKLQYVVEKGVQDQLLSQSNQRMKLMLEKAKSSQIKLQHMYKWQWGYLQNQQQHQMKILGFSGIELFTIIVTALIQMYSIKNLLDNRAVV